MAASTRFRRQVLRKIFSRWRLTVPGLIFNTAAISLLLIAHETRFNTFVSAPVSLIVLPVSRSRGSAFSSGSAEAQTTDWRLETILSDSTTLRLCGEFPNFEKFEIRNIVNTLCSLCVIRTDGINPSSCGYRAERYQASSTETGVSSDSFRGAPPPRVHHRESTGSL